MQSAWLGLSVRRIAARPKAEPSGPGLRARWGLNTAGARLSGTLDRNIQWRDCSMARVYKICSSMEWAQAKAAGTFTGSAVDLADGFIHLSDASQVRETARRYFATGDDWVLVAFDDAALEGLIYEPSRGGAMFPHVFAPIATKTALAVFELERQPDGLLTFPDEIA
jgi:uncharacterized protein (DUF952 family)